MTLSTNNLFAAVAAMAVSLACITVTIAPVTPIA